MPVLLGSLTAILTQLLPEEHFATASEKMLYVLHALPYRNTSLRACILQALVVLQCGAGPQVFHLHQ